MTQEDLDAMLEHLVAAAAASGDPEDGPGLITLSVDSRYSLPPDCPMTCTDILKGIRYRGLQVVITRAMQDAVFSRKEAAAQGRKDIGELEPKVAA